MLSYCGELVRGNDPDRFLISLFVPHNVREDIWALLAFNHEISKTREVVSDSALGHIRLQWWRDTISDLSKGTVRLHPVAEALNELKKERKIDFTLMQEMIDMRAKDLDPAPIATEGELIVYAEATGGNLHRLIHTALGVREADDAVEAYMRSGRAYALNGILRAIPFHAKYDLLLLPLNLLNDYGLDASTVFKADNKSAFRDVVASLKEFIDDDYEVAFDQSLSLSRTEKPAVLCNALTGIYQKNLEKAGFEPADPKVNPGNVRKIMAMFGYRYLG